MAYKNTYNNYDSTKNYRSVVFTAGSKLQSAELNEMQDIQLGYTSSIGNFLVSNGTVISGGEILTLNRSQIIISESRVSVQGLPVFTPQASIELTGLQETLGILIEESLVTGAEDEKILQPDPESPFYREETSYRKKVVGRWIKRDDLLPGQLFFPVLTVENGSIIASSANSNGNRDYINKSISTYDKGVHGSYVVEGLVIKPTDLIRDDGKHTVELTSGIARVNGDETKISTSRLVTLDPVSENVRNVASEPIIFIKGQSNYTLRNLPPKSITSVVGTKEVTETINRGGTAGSEDTLPHNPVLRIVEVKQGSTVYNNITDYIQVGDKISWTPSGKEPSPGSSYTVKYQYMDTFSASVVANRLQLSNADVAQLVHNTQLAVSYQFYLSRMDRIIIKNGNVVVVKGIPDTPSNIIPPSVDHATELSLGVVTLMFGQRPRISQDDMVTMIPFSELKKMRNQLSDVQYNILQLSLKEEAREMDMVTNKRGVIVDSLQNENMRDKGIAQNARVQDGILDIGSNFGTSTILNTEFIGLGTQLEYDLANQPVHTGDQRINPYATTQSAPVASCIVNPGVIYGNMWDPGYDGTELPRPFKVSIKLSKFNSAEQVKITFRGKQESTVATDNNGDAKYELTLPTGLPYSSYEVHATGLVSGAIAVGVFELKRNDESYNNYYTQLNLAKQAEINAQLQSNIDQLRSDMEQELAEIRRRISNLEAKTKQLEGSLNQLRNEMQAAFKRVNANFDQINSELNRLNARINATDGSVANLTNNFNNLSQEVQAISKQLPGYYIHYTSEVNNLTNPNQFVKIYVGTEYTNGNINFNQGSGTATTGSQMWEMGVIVKESTTKQISFVTNDDDVFVYVDGKAIWSRPITNNNIQTVNLNLSQGTHIIQIILNNKGNNLSHLQMSGDIVDKVKVFMNPYWSKLSIDNADSLRSEYEVQLAKQRAEEEARRQRELAERRIRRTDPVAQSFIPKSPVDISAVSCYLTELPTKILYCKIVENTAGQPDIFKLVGYGEIPTVKELRLGWNKIPLESKVSLQQDKEYSLIIITESFEGKVAIAKVGERDVNTNQYVKTQVDDGVLFLSANERTWVSVQDSDMVYKLHAVNYEATKTIKVGTLTPDARQENITDLRLVGQVKTNESTSVKFYAQVGGQRIDLALNRTVFTTPIKKSSGNIEIFAELVTTNQAHSPLINPGLLLLTGTAISPSTYIGRQWNIKNGQVSPAAIQVVLDQKVESGCKVTPYYQSGDDAKNDSSYTELAMKSSEPIGENWQTVIYEVKGVQRGSSRLKIKLETNHHENRPKVKNIRILVIDNY